MCFFINYIKKLKNIIKKYNKQKSENERKFK